MRVRVLYACVCALVFVSGAHYGCLLAACVYVWAEVFVVFVCL